MSDCDYKNFIWIIFLLSSSDWLTLHCRHFWCRVHSLGYRVTGENLVGSVALWLTMETKMFHNLARTATTPDDQNVHISANFDFPKAALKKPRGVSSADDW